MMELKMVALWGFLMGAISSMIATNIYRDYEEIDSIPMCKNVGWSKTR